MNQYYLVPQLPAFNVSDDRAPLPITEEAFTELCSRFLEKEELETLQTLSLEPPKEAKSTGSALVDSWYQKERELRYALAQIRALRLKKKLDSSALNPGGDVVQVARTACGMDSPLAAEQYLDQYRLQVLDNLRPMNGFATDSVFLYGLKLKLAARMKKFNAETGMASYHKIYDKILNEDSGENR